MRRHFFSGDCSWQYSSSYSSSRELKKGLLFEPSTMLIIDLPAFISEIIQKIINLINLHSFLHQTLQTSISQIKSNHIFFFCLPKFDIQQSCFLYQKPKSNQIMSFPNQKKKISHHLSIRPNSTHKINIVILNTFTRVRTRTSQLCVSFTCPTNHPNKYHS